MSDNNPHVVQSLRASLLAIVYASIALGCADTSPTTQSSGIRDRQEKALKDPFSVGGVEQQEKYDISGGGLNDFDKKSFKKDVDSVFSP